ncbi:MAG: hypothetical protein JST30_17330 [Armatimonadetes bacterium]|nr:hypothetical protein [Armatimonadota bacterium]
MSRVPHLLLALATSPASYALRYQFYDCGTIRFNNSDSDTAAYALNDSGMVVGPAAFQKAPFWFTVETGQMRMGPIRRSYQNTYPNDVNNLGEATGLVYWENDGSNVPFVWSKEKGFRIIPLPSDYPVGLGNGINDLGQVVGRMDGNNRASQPFLFTPGKGVEALGVFDPKYGCEALSVNETGVVVGSGLVDPYPGHSRAFRWTREKGLENLGAPDGFWESTARVVTGDGTIYGFLYGPLGGQAFRLRPGGGFETLGPLEVFDANDAGQVVGTGGTDIAKLYDPSLGTIDLNTVTDGVPQGWKLAVAYGINSRGDVCGIYVKQGSRTKGFFLKRLE